MVVWLKKPLSFQGVAVVFVAIAAVGLATELVSKAMLHRQFDGVVALSLASSLFIVFSPHSHRAFWKKTENNGSIAPKGS